MGVGRRAGIEYNEFGRLGWFWLCLGDMGVALEDGIRMDVLVYNC